MSYFLHPREAMYSRFWGRRARELRRRQAGILGYSKPRPNQPVWADYYPWAPGTVAEKIVFAELVRRGITFFFAPYWGDMPFTEGEYERFRPDFLLPEYRIIIEVFGSYWHTREESAEQDALRAQMYEASGYKHYVLWDWEIFENVVECLDNIPELFNPAIRTGKIFISDRPFDPTAGLRGAARRYARVVRERRRVRGLRTAVAPRALQTPYLKPPRRPRPPTFPGYGGLEADYVEQVREFGREWRDYVVRLGEFFTAHPEFQSYYSEEHRYWLRWKDWWDRWENVMTWSPEWREYVSALEEYFRQYPQMRYQNLGAYYSYLTWRRMGYRRL